ncbi:MAG: site-specific DNA-methyltransferase [Flavobacteriales bacterium]|nr:site-specific DNA-methyltransferase [Flavobacteriales bacterium]
MNKKEILDKIKTVEGLTNDERAYLVNLVNTKKKYGLVWEDKPEDVEEELRTKLPILKEVKERAIVNDTEIEKHPNHILIEGDNLHALTALTFTHENKIDAIYLDPPYNTGAKDWRYNNDYVDSEDQFRHSKWIAMMHKRLKLAKNLLVDDGIICVTIDDYEVPRLTLIMEEIFGEKNHLGTIIIRNNPSGRSTVKGVSITHEYALIFGKSDSSVVGRLPRNEKQRGRYKFEDEIGPFEWVNFRKHGGTRSESPSMYYPIFVTKNEFRLPELEWDDSTSEWRLLENPNQKESILYPIDENGRERRWKWGIDRLRENPSEFMVKKDKGGLDALYVKARMNMEGVLPLTWWEDKKYSATSYGTNLVKDLFGGELQVFSYPKSLHAVEDSLRVIASKPNAVILDVFAGSGTTLHATINLNQEDGGSRTCILATNNENNIAEEVTYERNKRVIKGYTNAKGEKVDGLKNNNLRYYQCGFVEREPSLANKRQLTQLATELLCIKEDCYQEATSQINTAAWNKLFTNGKGQFVYVVYDDLYIEEAVAALAAFVAKEAPESKIKVYVFANGQYAYAEEFEDIADNITLAALPDAIYKAYQNVLPKQNREFVPQLDEEVDVEPEMDFDA